jgi:hypothetical protein
MVKFIRAVHEVAESKNVFIDLSKVQQMTPEAVAVLLAMIQHCRIVGARISGNAPKVAKAQEMLNNSGFRSHVRNSPGFAVGPAKGRIGKFAKSRETSADRYSQDLAVELIRFATRELTGTAQDHGPSYSVFGEAMLNTLNHASKKGGPKEPWWASVYYDSDRKRACFTFLDRGVGIFRSHTLNTNLKFKALVGLLTEAQLLEQIFRGEIPSSTRIPGRGNGIPEMYDSCKAGRIRNFTAIANRACGEAEVEQYTVLSEPFEGTLLYWEITE